MPRETLGAENTPCASGLLCASPTQTTAVICRPISHMQTELAYSQSVFSVELLQSPVSVVSIAAGSFGQYHSTVQFPASGAQTCTAWNRRAGERLTC